MANKNQYLPTPQYPPTPDELKADSKKYVILGAVLVSVLIISALVYIIWPTPAVAPPPVAPPVLPVTAPPAALPRAFNVPSESPLAIADLKTCSSLDADFICVAEKTVFSKDDNIAIAYKVQGFNALRGRPGIADLGASRMTIADQTYVANMQRNIRIVDEADNQVAYPAEQLLPTVSLGSVSIEPLVYITSGENFNAGPLSPGVYFAEITIREIGGTAPRTTSERVRFEVR